MEAPVTIRPMLAASFDDQYDLMPELKQLEYPLLGSPKVDGIRFLRPENDGARSRSWKLLPNKRLQAMVENPLFAWLDGEVIVGNNPAAENLFNRTQSAIMTADDTSPLSIYIFDHWHQATDHFALRTLKASSIVADIRMTGVNNVHYLMHVVLESPEEVLDYEQEALEAGYEGIMLRHPNKPYKYGRSTKREQGLIKVKRFVDEEAEIVGFEELRRNQNEAKKNAFGLQVRGHSIHGKVAANTLGKLLLRNDRWGEFACGSGLDDVLRNKIWQNQKDFLGKLVTYKYQPHGIKEKPRSPIFKGFRPEVD
jgi:DNA ligase-1